MLGDEFFKALHQCGGPVAALAKAGVQQAVLGNHVDHQVCLLLHFQKQFAQGGRGKGLGGVELFLGLAGQVAPVYQEEHAACAAELDEAVDEADAGKRLAAAGGHLDQGFGLVGSQALL